MIQIAEASTTGQNSFILRPPTEEDIPTLVELFNDCAEEEVGARPATAEEIRLEWEDPGFDVAASSRVAVDHNGVVVGHVAAYCSAPYVRNFVNVHVHPTRRGLGLGSLLTKWAEKQVGAFIERAPSDTRVTVEGGAVRTFTPAIEFLRDQHYTYVRTFYEMRIELHGPPSPPVWPSGITARSMIPNQEEEAVYRADVEAFRDHWGYVEQPFEEDFPRWLHYTRNHPHYDPNFYFLALDGNEIAGMSLCLPRDNEVPDMAWVNTVAVRRPWRRQGLALALLHHTFGECYRHGIYKVGLGVDASSLTGATRLYEKAGMQVFRRYDRYVKELRPGRDLSTQQVDS